MKKLLLLVCVFLSFYAKAQDADGMEVMNEKYGFQGIRFETPVSEFKGLKLLSVSGQEKVYQPLVKEIVIGSFKASNPRYIFYQGKLSEISMIIMGVENVEGILDALSIAYGEPKNKAGEYYWLSTRMRITYKQIAKGLSGSLRFSSVYLLLKEQDDIIEKTMNDLKIESEQQSKKIIEQVDKAKKASKNL